MKEKSAETVSYEGPSEVSHFCGTSLMSLLLHKSHQSMLHTATGQRVTNKRRTRLLDPKTGYPVKQAASPLMCGPELAALHITQPNHNPNQSHGFIPGPRENGIVGRVYTQGEPLQGPLIGPKILALISCSHNKTQPNECTFSLLLKTDVRGHKLNMYCISTLTFRENNIIQINSQTGNICM